MKTASGGAWSDDDASVSKAIQLGAPVAAPFAELSTMKRPGRRPEGTSTSTDASAYAAADGSGTVSAVHALGGVYSSLALGPLRSRPGRKSPK